MKFWLINGKAESIRFGDDSLGIESRRRVRIAVGDALFLGNGMGHIEPMLYVVEAVEMKERDAAPELPEDFALGYQLPIEDEGKVYRYRFELKRKLGLDHPLELDDFLYSLSFVKRLEAPERHFRFPFREIPQVDADVLLNNRIFVSRTAFYSLYYALPARTRIEFDHREALNPSRQASYRARLERLIGFVEARILPVGEMLVEAAAQWRKLGAAERIGTFDAVHFADEDTRGSASAGRQLRAFEALFAELEPLPDDAANPNRIVLESLDDLQRLTPSYLDIDLGPVDGGFLAQLMAFVSSDGNRTSELSFERTFAAR